MPASKNTYLIKDTGGNQIDTIIGTSFEYEKTSGRIIVYDGEEIIASLINVQISKKPS